VNSREGNDTECKKNTCPCWEFNRILETVSSHFIDWAIERTTDRPRAEKLWLVCGVMGDVMLCDRERDIHRSKKCYATIHSEKNDSPHNSFILQTQISSSCMFLRWTIKNPLLLPTLPRSVGLSSPTSPV
jgi:hypothetical protein